MWGENTHLLFTTNFYNMSETRKSLQGLSASTISTIADTVLSNTYATRRKTGNEKFGKYMVKQALLLKKDPKAQDYIDIFNPCLAFLPLVNRLDTVGAVHLTKPKISLHIKDKYGRELFIGSAVYVYYQRDGVTEQIIARETKDGIYFKDNRYLLKTDFQRLARIRK